MNWTPKMDEIAAKLWNEGKSAGEVGAVVGKSRSAVIGRVHRKPDLYRRHGQREAKPIEGKPSKYLSARMAKKQARAAAVSALRAREKAEKPVVASVAPVDRVELKDETRNFPAVIGTPFDVASAAQAVDLSSVAFVDLKAGQCKYVMAESFAPLGPWSPCCGQPTESAKSSWCAVHAAIVCEAA